MNMSTPRFFADSGGGEAAVTVRGPRASQHLDRDITKHSWDVLQALRSSVFCDKSREHLHSADEDTRVGPVPVPPAHVEQGTAPRSNCNPKRLHTAGLEFWGYFFVSFYVFIF